MQSYKTSQIPQRNRFGYENSSNGNSYYQPMKTETMPQQLYKQQPLIDSKRNLPYFSSESSIRYDPELESIIQKYKRSYDQKQTEQFSYQRKQVPEMIKIGQENRNPSSSSLSNFSHFQQGNFNEHLQKNGLINHPHVSSIRPEKQRQRNPYLSDEDDYNDDQKTSQNTLYFSSNNFESTKFASASNQIQDFEVNKLVQRVVLTNQKQPTISIKKQTSNIALTNSNDNYVKSAILGICAMIILFITYKLFQ